MENHTSLFAEIVIDKYVDMAFDYLVPSTINTPVIGSFVKIPFQGRVQTGCIAGLKNSSEVPPGKLKSIMEVIDYIPPIKKNLLLLSKWIADYYGCPLGMVIKSSVPAFVFKTRREKKNIPEILSKPVSVKYELNADQKKALGSIEQSIHQPKSKVFLLWGVTGSGKVQGKKIQYLRRRNKAPSSGCKAYSL